MIVGIDTPHWHQIKGNRHGRPPSGGWNLPESPASIPSFFKEASVSQCVALSTTVIVGS